MSYLPLILLDRIHYNTKDYPVLFYLRPFYWYQSPKDQNFVTLVLFCVCSVGRPTSRLVNRLVGQLVVRFGLFCFFFVLFDGVHCCALLFSCACNWCMLCCVCVCSVLLFLYWCYLALLGFAGIALSRLALFSVAVFSWCYLALLGFAGVALSCVALFTLLLFLGVI